MEAPGQPITGGNAQVEVREIDSTINRLQTAQDTLANTVSALLERLEPVLSQQPTDASPGGVGGPPVTCPLAKQIDEVANRADQSIVVLQNALQRLQL